MALAESEAREHGRRLRPAGGPVRQGDPRRRELGGGGGATSRTTCARRARGDWRAPTARCDARSRASRRSSSSRSAASAPATAGSACRSPKGRSAPRSSATASAPTRCSRGTRTVLDIGGQDTKAIQVDEQGIVTSFQMNDRCAAGCGRYLGYIADEMNLGLHELGPARLRVDGAGAHQLDLHGVRRRRAARAAVARREARGHPRRPAPRHHPARDVAARALGRRQRRVHVHGRRGARTRPRSARCAAWWRRTTASSTINISPDSIYTGALGAALFALRDAGRSGAVPVAH